MIGACLAGTAQVGLAAGAPEERSWKSVAPGLEIRRMDGGSACRKGSKIITVARIQPEKWRVDLYHRSGNEAPAGLDIDGWQRRTGAAVMINASQYYPDRVPMGLFVKGGVNLGTRLLKQWKGVLVAEPEPRGRAPRADLLDLDLDPFDLKSTPYRVAVQSFMILDRNGAKRVRRSDWHANRTVVATDRRGRLLVVHTEGSYTLWEMADWLARSDLKVRHAMSLDGGFEAQMCVRAGDEEYLSFGQYHADDRGDHSMSGIRVSLPAVIGFFPR